MSGVPPVDGVVRRVIAAEVVRGRLDHSMNPGCMKSSRWNVRSQSVAVGRKES